MTTTNPYESGDDRGCSDCRLSEERCRCGDVPDQADFDAAGRTYYGADVWKQMEAAKASSGWYGPTSEDREPKDLGPSMADEAADDAERTRYAVVELNPNGTGEHVVAGRFPHLEEAMESTLRWSEDPEERCHWDVDLAPKFEVVELTAAGEVVLCVACKSPVDAGEADHVPPLYDDDAWTKVAEHHEPTCRWVLSRANALFAVAVQHAAEKRS